jgi:hypothetical protein
MNRQDAKDAKKRRREKESKPRTTEPKHLTFLFRSFLLFFPWRSWRLGGSF